MGWFIIEERSGRSPLASTTAKITVLVIEAPVSSSKHAQAYLPLSPGSQQQIGRAVLH
jgi:hypothetical protein